MPPIPVDLSDDGTDDDAWWARIASHFELNDE